MAVYTFEIPQFSIGETRAPNNDTLFASTALKVRNAFGALHHDWGASGTALGDRGDGSLLATGLVWDNVDVPDPTEAQPDGGSLCWTFTLINAGHADNGFLPALNKLTDAFAGALADKAVDAAEAGNVGAAFTHFLQTVELVGVQDLINLLTADCDGGVASGAFEFTAADLVKMVGPGNGVWKLLKNNPGTNSPAGCGSNSNYDVGYRISAPGSLVWSGDEDLGGILTSDPAAAAWGLNRQDCFYRGQNNDLWHRSWAGQGWSGEDDRGGFLSSSPAVASWGPNRLDCFYRGGNNHLWHRSFDGGWSGEDDRGGILTSDPAVAAWGPNRLDCFYRGQNNAMWHRWWDGHAWSQEEDLGGVLTSGPAAAARAPDHLDCFYRGQNEHLWHRWWDGNNWSAEEDLGGVLTSDPAAVSWGLNRLDCFYRGQNGHLWHRWWDGNRWSDEEDLGGELVGKVAAVSWGRDRIDCFYRGQNNHLLHRWYPAW